MKNPVSSQAIFVACAIVSLGSVNGTLPQVIGKPPVADYNLNAPQLPDPRLTPGDTLDVTAKDFCVPGYSKKVRNVPQSVKNQVYKNYGITHRQRGEYEVDHLISLQLGGSNSVKNLWPESYKTQPWNASVKDQLENTFHDDICKGRVDAQIAQQKIARDWIAAYKERFNTQVPLRKPAVKDDDDDGVDKAASLPRPVSRRTPRPKAGLHLSDIFHRRRAGAQVWVNLNSGKYWMPGSRYYGKTAKGKYLTEADAKSAGYTRGEGQ